MRYRRHLGPSFSEGARLLWKQLGPNGEIEQIRIRLKIGRGMVSKWLYGDRRPDLDSAVRIRKAFGILEELWLVPPKKAFAFPSPPPPSESTTTLPVQATKNAG